jgi:hypothetical protein
MNHSSAVAGMSGLSVDELVSRYRAAASAHGSMKLTDSAKARRAANRKADTVAVIYRQLRTRGAASVLSVLLEDPDPGVRAWAGAHALEFAPSQGEQVLEALAAEDTEPLGKGSNAKITLEEWRAGRLRFP